jgi:acetamidase/formamidase
MAMHTIEAVRENLHGHFSRDLLPVLEVESGDTIRFRTLDAGWFVEPAQADGTRGRQFEPRDRVLDRGHALCGPVFVDGAEPGMTLELGIGELRTCGWGWNVAGGFKTALNDRLGVTAGKTRVHNWTLDDDAGIATNQFGHRVRMNPHLGLLGVAPDLPGTLPTAPPRVTGGNIDCKELVTGSTLYLPIAVPGALFSCGDGHGAMSDGEASGTGIECGMERADITLTLRDDLTITTPRADTPAGWITFGFHEDLDEAMYVALDAMLDLMREQHGIDRRDALALSSLIVDLRVTQVVNGVRGVHAVLPHGALERV